MVPCKNVGPVALSFDPASRDSERITKNLMGIDSRAIFFVETKALSFQNLGFIKKVIIYNKESYNIQYSKLLIN